MMGWSVLAISIYLAVYTNVLVCHGFIVLSTSHTQRFCTGNNRIAPELSLKSSLLEEGEESSVVQSLQDLLEQNDTKSISIEAYVISKRSFGKPLVFVDLVSIDGQKFQALLRLDYYTGDTYYGHRKCLLRGARLNFTGVASPTRNPGEAVLLIHNLKLLGVPRQEQLIRSILILGLQNKIPREEVFMASHSNSIFADEQTLFDNQQNITSTLWAKRLSKQIFPILPFDPSYPSDVDQKQISKTGNVALADAPEEWRNIRASDLGYSSNTNDYGNISQILFNRDDGFISVSGWVQNRRRWSDNITLLQLVDDLTLLREDDSPAEAVDAKRLPCLILPQLVTNEVAGIYRNILPVGSKVWVKGRLLGGDRGLHATEIRLVQSSSRSVTIRHLLDLCYEKKIPVEEVADALLLPYQDVLAIAESSDATERRWKANKVAEKLQRVQKQTRVAPELLKVLSRYETITESVPVHTTSFVRNPIDEKIMSKGVAGSTWQTKKKPQLQWMSKEIIRVLESHPEFRCRKLKILDIGGGKGCLANYLGLAVDDVEIKVVDIAAGAVANGQMRAKRMNTPVEFQIADASSEELDDTEADVVIALHACGHLSDVALAHAVSRKAGFVICPCCYCSNPHLTIPNEDERVSVHEWIGLPESDWSALKLLAEVQGDISLASKAMNTICAIRADTVKRKLQDNNRLIEVRSFPIQYSTRNSVIVGTCS